MMFWDPEHTPIYYRMIYVPPRWINPVNQTQERTTLRMGLLGASPSTAATLFAVLKAGEGSVRR